MTKRADGLASKVLEINQNMTPKDRKGERYVPWCSFFQHQGIIKDEYVCKERHCQHYHRLYVNEYSQWIHQKK